MMTPDAVVFEESADEVGVCIAGLDDAWLAASPAHYDPTRWYVTDVGIPHHLRRQGLATKLYDVAAQVIGERGCKLVPSRNLSPEAFAFWMRRDRGLLVEVLKYFDGPVDPAGYDEEIVSRAKAQLNELSESVCLESEDAR